MYDNLTGEQIQIILDLFLYKALEPVILHSTAFDNQVSYLLTLITGNRKRKISSIEREQVIELLAAYLVVEDRREKFELIRSARIERSFIHAFLSRFLAHNDAFLGLYRDFMVNTKTRTVTGERLAAMATGSGCVDRNALYSIMSLSSGYLSNFYKYREVIVNHYVKMASKKADEYIESNPSMGYDFMDVRQNILKSVLTAIDKYNSDRGALTSYINWWVLNALTCGTDEHEYGIAYTIPQSQRKKIANGTSTGEVNFSVSMDTLTNNDDEDGERNLHNSLSAEEAVAEEIERSEVEETIRFLVKSVDYKGTARLLLDIGEFFSPKEREQMDEQMQKEFGHLRPKPVAKAAVPKIVIKKSLEQEPSRPRAIVYRSGGRSVSRVSLRRHLRKTVKRDVTLTLIGEHNGYR